MMRELAGPPIQTVEAIEHVGDRVTSLVVTIEPGLATPAAGVEDAIIVEDSVPESDWLVDAPADSSPAAEHEPASELISDPQEEAQKDEERKRAEMKEALRILEAVVAAGDDAENNLMRYEPLLGNTLRNIQRGDMRALKDLAMMMRVVRKWRNEAQQAGEPFTPQDAVARYRHRAAAYGREVRDYENAKFEHDMAVSSYKYDPNEHPDPGPFKTLPPKNSTVEDRYNLLNSFVFATRGKLPF